MKALTLCSIIFATIQLYMSNSYTNNNPTNTSIHYKYKPFSQYPLSAGLPQSLVKLNKQLKSTYGTNLVYLLIHHPSSLFENFDLSTAQSLLAMNNNPNLNTGHLQLAWSCALNDRLKESATGFTGDIKNNSFALAKSGYGLSSLLATHLDGQLEPPQTVDQHIKKSLYKDQLTILVANVGENCEAILANIWSFANSSNNNQFTIASLSTSKLKKLNCTSSIIQWIKPSKKLHPLLNKNSKDIFKAPNTLFKKITTPIKIDSVILPKIHDGINQNITLKSFLKMNPKETYIQFEMFSPTKLLKSIKWNSFTKKKFDLEGHKTYALLI